MFTRAQYKDSNQLDWTTISDPVATKKWDGAHFFVTVEPDGSLRYFSRRQSVKGHFPERTAHLPHLTETKLPHLAGNVYSVELIHTGHSKNDVESHSRLSGILNSLPERAIATQKETGPVRAVLIDVINPPLPTYREKLLHLKEVEQAFGKPDMMFVPEPKITKPDIVELINSTRRRGEEGVIITSLSTPEPSNRRIKLKHFGTYNLRVSRIVQEFDKNGKPKDSMGAVIVTDRSGREVAAVGSGFTKAQRKEAWANPKAWIGKLIQVKSLGPSGAGGRLRHPVYNGDADGELDFVE